MKKKPEIDSNTILQRKQDQPFTIIDEEVVMLDVKHEEYLNLNPHASYIWLQLEKPRSFSELIALLCREYEVDEQVCIRDTEEFLLDFLHKGIVHIL